MRQVFYQSYFQRMCVVHTGSKMRRMLVFGFPRFFWLVNSLIVLMVVIERLQSERVIYITQSGVQPNWQRRKIQVLVVVGSSPITLIQVPQPNGRGSGLKIHPVRVRIPVGLLLRDHLVDRQIDRLEHPLPQVLNPLNRHSIISELFILSPKYGASLFS